MKWSCSVFAAALLVAVAVGAVGGAAAGAAEEDPIDQTTSDPIDIGSTETKENIIATHHLSKDDHIKNFKGTTLGYVTPWNGEGYDVAKKYASKFNLIAPTWYRWEASASGKIRLTGQKDVDLEWAKAVKEAGKAHDLKITPRFVIEFDGEAVFGQGQDPRKQVLTMVALAVTECKKQNWDGLVFEASYIVKEMLGAIQVFSDQLHKEGKLLIITASPIPRFFDNETFKKIGHLVDYVSLMTYDFTTLQAKPAGPNAPMGWYAQTIMQLTSGVPESFAKKILAGLNWYGHDFVGDKSTPVFGEAAIKLLEKADKIEWDASSLEHFFTYKDEAGQDHTVYYPTVDSITDRVGFAGEVGTGVSVWELGQGLPYFYNIL